MKAVFLLAALMLMLSGCSQHAVQQSAQPSGQGQAAGQQDSQGKGTTGKDQKKKKVQKDQNKKAKGDAKQKKDNNQKSKADKPKLPKPEYYMAKNYYIKPIGNANPKVVLLTIDDAPDQHAVEMAKTLKKLHAKAIFFIIGDLIDSKAGKEKLKKIHDMGFPVGNHTYDHPFLSHLSKEKQQEELIPVYKELKKLTGEPVRFFRAPHGDNTEVSDKLAAERGVIAMNWSYGYDWHPKYENPQALTKVMLDPVDPPGLINGSILLMHDRPWTAKALPNIVKGLRKKGFKILDPALLRTPKPQK